MKLLEYYKWEVILDDDSLIKQSADGEKEPFKFDSRNPDLNKIKTFKLIPKESDTELKEITVEIPEGAKLIYFRRTIGDTGNMFPKFQLTLIGWQMNLSPDNKGKNIKYILHIFPDGNVYATTGQWPPIEEFVATLPQKNSEDIIGCTGCKPRLEKVNG